MVSYVIGLTLLKLLVRADWISGKIGGDGGGRLNLICPPDSWIDQVEGGIEYGWQPNIDNCVTQFQAKCTNGDSLQEVCGNFKDGVEVHTISNANGFDSISGAIVNDRYVGDLSFYHNGNLLGSFDNGTSQRTLACPENKVIMGLAVQCGAIVDSIELYCGLPKGYPTEIPTPTPSNMPTNTPTKTPTLMPTNSPTPMPTNAPTPTPTNQPTPTPTPTNLPTAIPTIKPTAIPTTTPSEIPTSDPTVMPTSSPSETPTTRPTYVPTWMPTILPTLRPTSSCPETVEKLEIVIDYLMDYLYCMKHAPNPDECSGAYNEFAILKTVKKN